MRAVAWGCLAVPQSWQMTGSFSRGKCPFGLGFWALGEAPRCCLARGKGPQEPRGPGQKGPQVEAGPGGGGERWAGGGSTGLRVSRDSGRTAAGWTRGKAWLSAPEETHSGSRHGAQASGDPQISRPSLPSLLIGWLTEAALGLTQKNPPGGMDFVSSVHSRLPAPGSTQGIVSAQENVC